MTEDTCMNSYVNVHIQGLVEHSHTVIPVLSVVTLHSHCRAESDNRRPQSLKYLCENL